MDPITIAVLAGGAALAGRVLIKAASSNGSSRTITKQYRVNGVDAYTITYRQDGRNWRICCSRHPRNPRSTSEHVTHLNPKNSMVCVTKGKEPKTLDKAIAVAQVWMNGYSEYIRTGKFPNKGQRVDV